MCIDAQGDHWRAMPEAARYLHDVNPGSDERACVAMTKAMEAYSRKLRNCGYRHAPELRNVVRGDRRSVMVAEHQGGELMLAQAELKAKF